ncbi:50S ribosomal protein L13 [candidate division WOR-1 bacterium DG_54_3]|uniref:Large ribosomal subunit protein uL13 n=1 Tax=candidate division WOR-1 bacterium DG_54_3 TaxID=1703775 RepID=A0A0S7Y533_UNCSA|nr:MAG: 50S ribosomal protein L13 [candidate division WOR-1 bacterium DG_54_3]
MKKNQTVFAKKEEIKRGWYLVDANQKVLGRMSTKIATYLRGKHKPIFSPHVDCGDYVVVINAAKVRITGRKEKQKLYFTHSGYPAGDKLISFEKMIEKSPEEVIRLSVAGMLPKNRLGRQMLKKLKIYSGAEHPHQEQKLHKLEV